MQKETYELIAMFMRYWFVFLIVIITFRAVKWLMGERRAYRKTLRSLPDAGLIGELVDINTGDSYPIPREGVIGSRQSADIRLRGMKHVKVIFQLEESKGIHLHTSRRNREVFLDGYQLEGDGYALHGSLLSLPGCQLRFRLFSGLNIPLRRQEEWQEQSQEYPGFALPGEGGYAYTSQNYAWPYMADAQGAPWPVQQEEDDEPSLSPLIPPETSQSYSYRSTTNGEG